MRYVAFLLIILASYTASAAEPWQQWRVDASSSPERWLQTTSEWIETYNNQRQYSELAMAYAIRSEALRYVGNENQAQETIEEGLRFAELSESPVAKSLLRINQTWYYLQRGLLGQAATSAVYAAEAAKKTNNDNLLIEADMLHAQVFHKSGDISRALEILESLEQQQYSDMARLQVEYHSLIGAIYLDVGATNIALDHMLNALQIARDKLGKWDVSVLEYNMGRAYLSNQEYQQASQHLKTALSLSRSINDDLGIAYALYRLAEIEQIEGRTRPALELMQQALPVFKKVGAHPMEAEIRLGISRIHLVNKELTKLKASLTAAESLINTLSDPELKQSLHELLSEYHQQTGNFERALTDYKQSVQFLLEHQRAIQQKQIQEIMVRLEIREQEATNELLKKENQVQQLQLKEQQTSNYLMVWLLLSGAAIFLLISYFLFQQMKSRKRYAELALKDDLTGAPNRRAIVRFCKQGLAQVKQNQRRLALAIIDFDYFKQINDNFGHDVGDHVLQRFAEVTQNCLRSNDKFGRMGGEEWLLVFFDADENDAELIFGRLLEMINKKPIQGLPQDYRVTFSMGFAAATQQDDFESLYKRADDVLYDAKHKGRQRLQVAPEPMVADS
ncbi:GGDEF domain-containing protein [Idiomarina seosinensis]|uniref:diguanylate cyclase n=1 Tax=Idiomarina seosinensis TaxID=281739 RepID=A0A432ZL63_9GAMM|nr:GGDEF domain-containing protein [Idiomarina seosinensis]RUO77962.1 GGDEF domain-containing protein [Idiomarina seosinensis]